jgi:Na+/phosphate symporter
MDSHSVAHSPDVDRAEIVAMAEEAVQMLRFVHQAFGHLDARPTDQASRIGRLVHQQGRGLIGRLVGRSGAERPPGHPADEEVVFVPMHLERIADNLERLASSTARMVHEGTLFTDRASREVGGLLQLAIEMLEGVRDAIRTGNHVLIRYVIEAGLSCETQAHDCAHFHEKRLVEGVCQPRASSVYLAMLDDIKGIEWHARQIAQKLQRVGISTDSRPSERQGRVNQLS